MDKYVISFLAPQKTVSLGRIEPFYGPNNTFFHLAISISICYTRFNLRQSGLKPKSYSQPRTTSVRLSLQTVFVKPICAICCCSAILTPPDCSGKMSPYGKQGDIDDERTAQIEDGL